MENKRNNVKQNEQKVRASLNGLVTEGYLNTDEKQIIVEKFLKIENEWNDFSSKVIENFNNYEDNELNDFLFFILNDNTKNEITKNVLINYIKTELEKAKNGDYYIIDEFSYHTAEEAAVKLIYKLVENEYGVVEGAYNAQDIQIYQEVLGLTDMEIFQLLFKCPKKEAFSMKLMSGAFEINYDCNMNKYITTYVVMTYLKYFNFEDLPVFKKHKRLMELLEKLQSNKEQAEEIGLQIAEL